jgi:phosphoglucomutase
MIRFGTAGWRGIISDEFTFSNVRLVSQAIANYVTRERPPGRGIVIGYDTRFLSEKFAHECARIISNHRIPAYLTDRDVPTPALSAAIIRKEAQMGINFTASHNPPEYNGLKLSTHKGAAALPDVTEQIEREIRKLEAHPPSFYYLDEALIEEFSPQDTYLSMLDNIARVDRLTSDVKVAVDTLWGTARDYLDRYLMERGCAVEVLHNFRDPYFGGYGPEATEETLGELRNLVVSKKFHLGVATDGDADRFGIIDSDGTYITANQTLALLLDYLIEDRKWKGSVARSVATTHLIDAIARKHDMPVLVTPVGFKYLAELFLDQKIILGCEESAGLSVQGHLPEKDGILTCVLVAEMVATRKENLKNQLQQLYRTYGYRANQRKSYKYTETLGKRVQELAAHPPKTFSGKQVVDVNTIDGLKMILEDGSWVLVRVSGTEQLIRVYAESESEEMLAKLMKSTEALLHQNG